MLYRITLDLSFTDRDAVDDILDKALDHLSEAVTINQGQINQEIGQIITEKCYHDEDPLRPCELTAQHFTPN